MAHGDRVDLGAVTGNVLYSIFKLLDGATSTDNGVWVESRGFPRMTIDIFGSFTGTIQLMGSNEVTKPSNATDGRLLGLPITSPSIIASDSPVSWIKAKVTAYTGGTINANLHMVSM